MVSTRKDASVIVKSKFVLPTNETFQKYIDYVDRDEAKRNEAYDKYSSYSQSYGELQFHKQQERMQDQKQNIIRLQEKIKEENTKLYKINSQIDKYESYKDYLDEFDSLKELFSKDSEVFNWKEKRELRKNYKDLLPDSSDFSTEDKAVELFSNHVEKMLDNKKTKLNQTKVNKENYIRKLEGRLNNSLNKVAQMEERLKNYDKYMDYMGNPEKTSSLFTESSNNLNKDEKNMLKENFKIAHSKGSIMWQDVISFDNKWLEENGLYDSKSHTVDEDRLKNIVRLSMKEMLKKENMDKNTIWSGAIHYNTDNIHVHIATVEPSPTRERGKRKLKSLESMKSKVVNNIMDRSQEQKEINDLIRNRMVKSKKDDNILSFRNRNFKKDFLEIYNALPEDRRQWSYGYNSLSSIRPKIDKMTTNYIEKYHKNDFEEFLKRLDKEVDVFKKTYGSSDKKRYQDYKKNKVDDLYKRMGNAFLQEMKDYDNQLKAKNKLSKIQNGNMHRNKRDTFKQNIAFNNIKYGVERILNSEYKNWKNQLAYEQLQRDIEMER